MAVTLPNKMPLQEIPKLILYRRPLHPELFKLHARRVDRHSGYEAESWLVEGGHVVRFHYQGTTLLEVCMSHCDHLPESGFLHALPCIGERDYEHAPVGGVGYITSLQTENLSENLYSATYREMMEFAEESGAISFTWDSPAGKNLSVLDVQRYRGEFHVQSYHLTAEGGSVLRTQTMFEVANGK